MRLVKKLVATFALVACVVGVGVVATATPAAAFAHNCTTPEPNAPLCLYSGHNGTGVRWKLGPSAVGCVSVPGAFNDITSSGVNLLSPWSARRAVILYEHINCQGSRYVVIPWGQTWDAGISTDNMVSSVGVLNGPFGG